MAKRLRVPISTARATLFQLGELVRRSGDDVAVVLEQRGVAEPLALVREARLAYLEERVRQLDEERREEPFTLAGSLASDQDDEALGVLLREVRAGWVAAPRETTARRRPRSRVRR
jgi:hypothetical protein